jgi:hypothetical protein
MRSILPVTTLLAVLLSASAARAETWDYAHKGVANAAAYSFAAIADGDLTAYFMPSTGSYQSALGVKVNGSVVGSGALPMGSTPDFVSHDFGAVAAGDTIEFFIDTYDTVSGGAYLGRYFSDIGDNADGLQHVWAAYHPDQWYLGPAGVPEGVFIGFEDMTTGDVSGDFNYADYTFVVPNLLVGSGTGVPAPPRPPAPSAAVPEPSTWALMIGGLGLVGGVLRRRRITFATG